MDTRASSILASGQITLVNLDDTFTVSVTNEAQVIPTTTNRLPLATKTYSTVITVYQGVTPYTNFTIGTINSANGITVTKTENTVKFTVNTNTALSVDDGEFIIPIIIDEDITINKTFSWTCSKQGEGIDAKYVIVNGEQIFMYTDNFAGTPTPGSITLTAQAFGISSPKYTWGYRTTGSSTVTTISGQATNTLSVAHNASMWGSNKQLTFRCTVDGVYYDEITIAKVSSGVNGTDGKDGINGTDGTSSYFHVRYSANANGSGMTTTPQSNTKYMGTCTTISSTSPTQATSYTWTLIKGSDGPKGDKGDTGASGKGVSTITEYYLATSASSGVTTSTSGWTTGIQSMTSTNRYLWNYEVIKYTDNSTTTTTPVVIGVYGNTGSTGATGNGISSITNYYLATTAGSGVTTSTSGWTTTVQTMTTTNKYLWNYEVIKYTNSTSYTGTPRIIGVYGATGASGADAYTVILSNENHTFPAEYTGSIGTAISTTSSVIAYKGATKVATTVGTITNPSGMTITINSNGTTSTSLTITANSGTSLAETGSVNIPITVDGKSFTRTFSWTKAKKGGTGANAKSVDIIPSTQYFKSTDGGITFSPDTITLTPLLQELTFSKWQYSVNGGSTYTDVRSGSNGLTVSNGVLTIAKSSALYTTAVTSLVFKVITNNSTYYDTVTIARLYDIADAEIGGENILRNTDFSRRATVTNVGWDNSKNGTTLAVSWGNYNGGVPSPSTGYHAHLYLKDGVWVGRYVNESDKRWKAFSQQFSAFAKTKIIGGQKYTFSVDVYSETAGCNLHGGLYSYKTGSTTPSFYSSQFSFTPTTLNKWIRMSWTFTVHSDINVTQNIAWYIYGYNGAVGTIYMKNPMLQKGTKATEWVASKEDTSDIADDKVNNQTQSFIFNKLTNNGALQGLYMENNKLYVNASYIKTGEFDADLIKAGSITAKNGRTVFDLDNSRLATYNSNGNPTFTISNGTLNFHDFEASGTGSGTGVFDTTVGSFFVETLTGGDVNGRVGINFDSGLNSAISLGYTANKFGRQAVVDIYGYGNTSSSEGRMDVYGLLTVKNSMSTTGSITTSGAITTSSTIKATGQVTSLSSVRGTTFTQSNYGLPLEIGKYIDMHQSGSSNDVDVRLVARDRQGLQVARGDDLSRYVELGTGKDDRYFYNSTSKKYLAMKDDGRLTYDSYTVPHNWRQNFTPFIYSATGNFTMVEQWGEAVFLGDLVWVRGRVRGSRGGHSGGVNIGGLPVSCVAGYPALNIAFFGGITTTLGSNAFEIKCYIESSASHAILNYTDKSTGGWHALQCSHLITGNIDISFSATYRWR